MGVCVGVRSGPPTVHLAGSAGDGVPVFLDGVSLYLSVILDGWEGIFFISPHALLLFRGCLLLRG